MRYNKEGVGGGTVTDDDDLHVQNSSENFQGIVFAEIYVF